MPKYKCLISYDGTNYVGWQIQPKGSSIQGLLEKTVTILLREPTRIIGAGRTDAGVHALGQVAHFETDTEIDIFRFLKQANAILPRDIRILDMGIVSPLFHSQYSATGKTYYYHICLGKILSPFVGRYRYHIMRDLDLDLVREGAKFFVGTHDFASFTNAGHSVKTTTRTLYRLDVNDEEGGVRLEFEGSGFLYKMVRNIVGVLVEVGDKKRALSTIPFLFESMDRRMSGATAPPQGLFLVKVNYEM